MIAELWNCNHKCCKREVYDKSGVQSETHIITSHATLPYVTQLMSEVKD
jgi:hypothetical protein